MFSDLVKRFTRTPLHATLRLNHVPVHVETNHPLLLCRLGFEAPSWHEDKEAVVAHWRIVVENEINLPVANSPSFGIAHDGLAFVRVAPNGRSAPGAFLAADQQAGLGIGFVALELVEQEGLFTEVFFPALWLMLRETEGRA
jgi:hypothetical protein